MGLGAYFSLTSVDATALGVYFFVFLVGFVYVFLPPKAVFFPLFSFFSGL